VSWWDREFWQEYIRVETDRFLLLILVFIFLGYDPGGDLKMVLGALVYSLQNNRFQSRPK